MGREYPEKIIISGATGFIGRRLAPRLKNLYPRARLTCLAKINDDHFCQTGAQLLRNQSIDITLCDLVTGYGLAGLTGADILFHLAANTHTWEANQRCNDAGTENLVRAMRLVGPGTHVIFTSTVAVMDNRVQFGLPLRPDTRLAGPPLSEYGRSKLRAEEGLKNNAATLGFALSILRLPTVYGSEPRPNTFFDVLKRHVLRRSVPSRMDWPGLNSFIHVDDVVECLLNVATNPPYQGQPTTEVLATESCTTGGLASALHHRHHGYYRRISMPEKCWDLIRLSRYACRLLSKSAPAKQFNHLWRLNLLVNPVFYCDTRLTHDHYPHLNPRRLEDVINAI